MNEPALASSRDPDAGGRTGPGHLAIGLLALVALILLLGDLGGLDLWAPDEPRYGQVAEELRRMDRGPGDLVLLRLGGEPYTQKPPLYFWLAAGLGALRGGVDEWAARLPSALAGLATIAVWVRIGRRRFPGSAIGWITGALLLTSFRFIHFARRAQLDVLLALFESVALLSFLEWHAATDPRRRRSALGWLYGASACALLTKGPVGLWPWACFALVLVLEGRRHELRDLFPIWGVAVAISPVLIWIGTCLWLAPAGFFEAAIVDNLWSRVTEGTDHARPFWYFLVQLPIEALPWSLLWPLFAWQTMVPGRRAREADQGVAQRDVAVDPFTRRIMLAWVLVPLILFSLSAGKRGPYMLASLPALCLWGALCIERVRVRSGPHPWLDGPRGMWGLGVVLGAGALAAGAWATYATGPSAVPPAIAAGIARMRWGLLLLAGGGALASLLCVHGEAKRRWAPRGLCGATGVWVMVAGVWALVLFAVLPALDSEKSPRPLAEALSRATRPGESVGLFGQATLQGGLLFYGDRPVQILESNQSVRDFVDHGGRVVLVKARQAAALEAIGALRVVEAARSGPRTQWVVELPSPRMPGDVTETFQ